MTRQTKQRIRSTASSMDKPFTVTALKMKLPGLVFKRGAPKGKEWRTVLDEMVAEGSLAVHEQGASAPLGGTEGDEKQRQYIVVKENSSD